MNATRSNLPAQTVTREQAVRLYREILNTVDGIDKEEFDADVRYYTRDFPTGRERYEEAACAMLQLVEQHGTKSERRMSAHAREHGEFTGGHVTTDARQGVRWCEQLAQRCGLRFEPAPIRQYAI